MEEEMTLKGIYMVNYYFYEFNAAFDTDIYRFIYFLLLFVWLLTIFICVLGCLFSSISISIIYIYFHFMKQ